MFVYLNSTSQMPKLVSLNPRRCQHCTIFLFQNKDLTRSLTTQTTVLERYSTAAMACDSPPPLDACPGLTPDNGTPTSSCSGSVYRNRIIHHVEEDTGNSQSHHNASYIFNNVNHQTSFSDNNNAAEHNDAPARERSTSGSHQLRSPNPAPTSPPCPSLPSQVRTEAISPIDIGPPLLPLSFDSHPAAVVEFVGEPTETHSSNPSSSEHPTITSPSGGPSRKGHWLMALLPNFSAWFGREARENENGARPRPRLSLGWFARRRDAKF